MRHSLPRHVPFLRAAAGVAMVFAGAGAAAANPVGRWSRDDGLGGIRIVACGDALCGFVTWLKNPKGPGRVGQRVLYDMRPVAGDTWAGSAYNPEDGREYAGTLKLAGDRLITRGCVLAGLVCRSVTLRRDR